MTAAEATAAVTDDAVLGGRLRLLQPRRGHRFGHDAVLLAAAAAAAPGDHAVDLGAGVGAAGLALAARLAGVRVTLVERDPELAALAAANAQRNGLAARVRAAALDVAAPAQDFVAAGLPPGCARHVIMNPPFSDGQRQQRSPDPLRAAAHVGGDAGLAAWCGTARRLLAPGGTLTLIWRADGLAAVLAALAAGFGAVAVCPIHPRPDAPAIRVVASACKAAAMSLVLAPPLVLNGADGRPSAAAEAILRAAAPLAVRGPQG